MLYSGNLVWETTVQVQMTTCQEVGVIYYVNSTSHKATSDWGNNCTTAQATTSPRDYCTLLSHFKLDSNGMKKAKLFYSGSTTQLATKVALIGETTAEETTGPVDN